MNYQITIQANQHPLLINQVERIEAGETKTHVVTASTLSTLRIQEAKGIITLSSINETTAALTIQDSAGSGGSGSGLPQKTVFNFDELRLKLEESKPTFILDMDNRVTGVDTDFATSSALQSPWYYHRDKKELITTGDFYERISIKEDENGKLIQTKSYWNITGNQVPSFNVSNMAAIIGLPNNRELYITNMYIYMIQVNEITGAHTYIQMMQYRTTASRTWAHFVYYKDEVVYAHVGGVFIAYDIATNSLLYSSTARVFASSGQFMSVGAGKWLDDHTVLTPLGDIFDIATGEVLFLNTIYTSSSAWNAPQIFEVAENQYTMLFVSTYVSGSSSSDLTGVRTTWNPETRTAIQERVNYTIAIKFTTTFVNSTETTVIDYESSYQLHSSMGLEIFNDCLLLMKRDLSIILVITVNDLKSLSTTGRITPKALRNYNPFEEEMGVIADLLKYSGAVIPVMSRIRNAEGQFFGYCDSPSFLTKINLSSAAVGVEVK